MRLNFHSLRIIFISILWIQCQQFTGYDFDAESMEQTARIYGTVTSTFTGSPIIAARITAENVTTESDGWGNYLMVYILRDDEIRNRPVQIQVVAPNYHTFSGELVLYPTDTRFDISLDYAAPVIRKNVLVWYAPGTILVCQALIVDYQGIATLQSVRAKFDYLLVETGAQKIIEIEMNFIQTLSDTAAFYQCLTHPNISGGWSINPKGNFEIIATDQSGYVGRVSKIFMSGAIPDTLLFPPVIGE